jgi:hypothetical protein
MVCRYSGGSGLWYHIPHCKAVKIVSFLMCYVLVVNSIERLCLVSSPSEDCRYMYYTVEDRPQPGMMAGL